MAVATPLFFHVALSAIEDGRSIFTPHGAHEVGRKALHDEDLAAAILDRSWSADDLSISMDPRSHASSELRAGLAGCSTTCQNFRNLACQNFRNPQMQVTVKKGLCTRICKKVQSTRFLKSDVFALEACPMAASHQNGPNL